MSSFVTPNVAQVTAAQTTPKPAMNGNMSFAWVTACEAMLTLRYGMLREWAACVARSRSERALSAAPRWLQALD